MGAGIAQVSQRQLLFRSEASFNLANQLTFVIISERSTDDVHLHRFSVAARNV